MVVARQQVPDIEYHLQYCFHKKKALGSEWVTVFFVALLLCAVDFIYLPPVTSGSCLIFSAGQQFIKGIAIINGNKEEENCFLSKFCQFY